MLARQTFEPEAQNRVPAGRVRNFTQAQGRMQDLTPITLAWIEGALPPRITWRA